MDYSSAIRHLEDKVRVLHLMKKHRMRTSYNLNQRIGELESAIRLLKGKSHGTHRAV